ncbi:c-type cytochrome [Halomonas saccharevitans]|uniref:Cytochrome c556 n=1 Tax=Halomonas saccharevitans TaxID=416872 RepID=A0A1I6ZYS2_9GAMM|nr:cytochrome c [Halomonas saccharevitans]SFT67816.1 Cytochrome c556 [Halomonas saccharevitans]
MTLMRRPLIATAALTLALVGTTSSHAADVDKSIEYRQDALGVIGWQIGPLGDMAQGKVDYDAEEFARRAENLAAVAPLPWEGFVKGSLRGDGHGVDTAALADIADDWEDFESRQQAMIEETATLAELAQGNDFTAMRRQVAAVADTCKGCHDNYKAE